MTRSEAAPLLAALATAYHHPLDEAASELWFVVCLESIEAWVGDRTVRRLIARDQRWPAPARFNEVRRAVQADVVPDHPQIAASCRYRCTDGWLYDPSMAQGIYEFVRRCPDCGPRSHAA